MDRIVTDSCCDTTPEMRADMGITSVPLTMIVGENEYPDNESLDMNGFMSDMKNTTGRSRSAAPAPDAYREAIESADEPFVVTLSSKLSASHGNAQLGNKAAGKSGRGAAFIFDSKSASAGETLIAIKLHELIRDGVTKDHIIQTVTQFIDNMKTYFVLENYNNLKRNGRLNKTTGAIIHLLNIKLVMGADENGEIKLFEKCRGIKRALQSLLSLIESSGKEPRDGNLVISHCNNRSLAEELSSMIKARFQFKKIIIVPTGGISSLYADDKGIVLAF